MGNVKVVLLDEQLWDIQPLDCDTLVFSLMPGTDWWLRLARRFFRLFKWVDCWNLAHREYEAGPLYPHLLPSSSGTVSVAGRASAKDYISVSGESEQKAWPTANEIRSRLDDEKSVVNDSRTPEDTSEREGLEVKVQRRAKGGDEVYTMLAVIKWSLLGMYFLMEMWTIVGNYPPCCRRRE